MIELRTLGTLELTAADGTSLGAVLAQPRRTALLCYLAITSTRGFQRRDTLYATFWPEHDARGARHALRQSLYFLRRALGAKTIASRGDDELTIDRDCLRCDAAELERALRQGQLEQALALYRGELLPAFHISDAPEFERWLDQERERLRRQASDAAWQVAQAREREGDAAGAGAWGRRAVALAPGDETSTRRLIQLLDRLGDGAAAVQVYETHARVLEREYELRPSAETERLVAAIRARQQPRPPAGFGSRPARAAAPQVATPAETRAAPARVPIDKPVVSAGPPAASAPRPLRRRRRVLAALAAVSLLAAIATARWMAANGAPRAGVAALAGERILIADFGAFGCDTIVGKGVSQALRMGLPRAPVLRVVGEPEVADALLRMRRSPGAALSPPLAREVAIREGIKGVIEGEVRRSGGYLVTATLQVAASGERIQAWHVTAHDSTELPAAVEHLINVIRRDAGGTLAGIRVAERPWRRTTSSLPALLKHMEGVRTYRRGDFLAGARLEQEALELDPDFAYAHLALATALDFAGIDGRQTLDSWTRAYQLRDRLMEAERFAMIGNYELHVRGDVARAIDAFRGNVAAAAASGESPWYASLGQALMIHGQYAQAARTLQEARHVWVSPINQLALATVLVRLGRPAEGSSVLADALARYPGLAHLLLARAYLRASVTQDYAAAHALADSVAGTPGGWIPALSAQAEFDAARGRLREASAHLRALRRAYAEQGLTGRAVEVEARIALLRLRLGEADAALSELDTAVASPPADPVAYPYFALALTYAAAGRAARAEALLRDYLRLVPGAPQPPDRWNFHRVRAALRLAQDRPLEALAEFHLASAYPPVRPAPFAGGSGERDFVPVEDYPELARVYDRLGQRDSAVAVLQRYVQVSDLYRSHMDALQLGGALQRLAQLHEAGGDRAQAAVEYRRLAELWSGADPELRAKARAAAQRAAALTLRPGGF